MNDHSHTNHLIHERSPYLLSHAHNPVDWYPWGPEAFEKAKREDKPVFLSIGYSTCHWCHVMERESFEDEQAAKLLNDHYVSIKVDREERPDIDSVYMAVCQAVNHSGGWPLTIIMTPQQEPFFAATYLPREGRGQMPGLMQVLKQLADLWKKEPEKLRQAGTSICEHLAGDTGASPDAWPEQAMLHQAAGVFLQTFDKEYGGFGQEPKFPAAHNLLFLLRYGRLHQNKTVEYVAAQTLYSMMRGGIFDHIGGGFSRYSTDRRWLVPHFEKMLYDNALLAMAYLECWAQTGADWSLWTAERIFTYVFRELTGEEGGFFCGQDADSEGVEGKYYGLSPDEICRVLGEPRGQAFCARYDITEEGNFEGMGIPNLLHEERPWLPDPETEADREKLYGYRRDRYPLHKDDKILTSWDSLMAAACAKGARAAFRLGGQEYPALGQCLLRGKESLAFVRDHLTDGDGRLMVRYREGEAGFMGHLDDYAFYAYALLEMYGTVFEAAYLEEALRVAEMMVTYFQDREKGGYYLYASDGEQLISRPKDTWDGAMPSGNSVAAHVLCRLAALTALPEWIKRRDRQLSFLAEQAKSYPSGYSFALLAMTEVLYPSRELVCVLPDLQDEQLVHRLAAAAEEGFHVLVKTLENADVLARLAPFTADYPLSDTARYYLCEGGSCQKPTEDLDEILIPVQG